MAWTLELACLLCAIQELKNVDRFLLEQLGTKPHSFESGFLRFVLFNFDFETQDVEIEEAAL